MKIIFIFIFLITLQIFAKEIITIDGGAAPIQNIFRKIEKPFEAAYPKYDLVILENGSDEAIKKVDQGKIDLATSGLNPEDWKELSEKKHYPIDLTKFQFRAIGRDLIKVYLNPGLTKIKKLSNEELEKIFSGKITNWKKLGGPDQKIILVFGSKIPGIYLFFKKYAMPKSDYIKGIEVSDIIDVQNEIFKTKGSIGLGNDTLLVKGLIVPSIEELGRQMYSATQGMPSEKVRQLLEYIHQEGAQYIKNEH